MAGHAELKFVMTECSKTQIRLTRHIRKVKTMPVNFTGDPLCSYFDERQKNEIYFLSVLELNTQ